MRLVLREKPDQLIVNFKLQSSAFPTRYVKSSWRDVMHHGISHSDSCDTHKGGLRETQPECIALISYHATEPAAPKSGDDLSLPLSSRIDLALT